MISIATLNELQDAELRNTIEQAEGILKQRDADRKAQAIENARATLAAAGLTLKDLGGNGKKKAAKGPVYHSGHTYQHPTDKTLSWNGKGKKPNWLVSLETEGGKATERAAMDANDDHEASLDSNHGRKVTDSVRPMNR
jgi:DNA-binding protein H-NS